MRVLAVVVMSIALVVLLGGCLDNTTPSLTDEIQGVNQTLIPGVDPVTNGPTEGRPEVFDPTVAPAVATAVLIDFEGLPYCTNVFGAPDNPASVLTNQLQYLGVLFGKAGVSLGVAVSNYGSFAPSSGVLSVVGLDAAGIIPSVDSGSFLGDIYFSFVVPGTSTPGVTDQVSFTIGDNGGDLDIFQIRSYALDGTLIDSQDHSNNSRFPVSISVAGIHRVEVDFTGDFGYSLDDLGFNDPVAVGPSLDIKPGSCPNPVNVKSKGVVPAALLGTAAFDVQDIDVSTLLLEGVPPIRYNYEDVSTPFTGTLCGCTMAGPDGYMDLTLKFDTQDLVAAIPMMEGAQELTLTGNLLDGTPFEASDCIVLKGLNEPGTPFERADR